jgi:Ca2+-binding RTX toxin-like protein
MTGRVGLLTCVAILLLAAGVAQAQSTCSFDPATARVTVSVNGLDARLKAVAWNGKILLNDVACAGATVFNTDSIQVNGSTGRFFSLIGKFEPGLTPEATGGSEIEISFAPDDGYLTIELTQRPDRLVFTSDGIDVGNDGDRDILMAGTRYITVYGQGGNDRIDASAYTSFMWTGRIFLYGGPGDDVLIGGTIPWMELHGEDGDDVLIGGDNDDELFGGMGADRMVGNGGNDYFGQRNTVDGQEAIADGADDIRGGDGFDWLDYGGRINGITVTVGDTEPDGEPGEGDLVRGDVEQVKGGSGPDVLVGNGLANLLEGNEGDDELYGGGGNDTLIDGQDAPSNDILVGGGGDDTLEAGLGDDFLDGGLGDDLLYGDFSCGGCVPGGGADILHGGPGADALDGGDGLDEFFGQGGNDTFVNDDGYGETVDCGPGAADDPQPSSLDTFIACELI